MENETNPAGRPVTFTQFLRPNGRREEIWIVRPHDIAAKADAIKAAGYRFEAEVLTTGHVHIDVCGDVDGEDVQLSSRIVDNGPEVLTAVDELVLEAHARVFPMDGEAMMPAEEPGGAPR